MNRITEYITPLYQGIIDSVNGIANIKLVLRSSRIKQFVYTSLPFYAVFAMVNMLYYWYTYSSDSYLGTGLWWGAWLIPAYIGCAFVHYKTTRILWNSIQEKKTDTMRSEYSAGASGACSKYPNQLLSHDGWEYWSEVIYGVLLSVSYSLMTWILSLAIYYLTPMWWLSVLCSIISFSWTISWGVFEYKLIYEGKDLFQRIRYFERRWLYFIGYGLPVAVIYSILSFPIKMSIWFPAIMFLTIRAVIAYPIKAPKIRQSIDHMNRKVDDRRVRIFYLAEYISTIAIINARRFITTNTAAPRGLMKNSTVTHQQNNVIA